MKSFPFQKKTSKRLLVLFGLGWLSRVLLRESPKPSLDGATKRKNTYADGATSPHCDVRILHAPKTCLTCDHFPEWQDLRMKWGIAFTGQEPTDDQPIADPADLAVMMGKRGALNKWSGNRPSPYA